MVLRVLIILGLVAIPALASDLDRGIQLYESGKYDEAERILRSVVDSDAKNARAHQYLGLALLNLDKPEEALASLRHADQLDPRLTDVKLGLTRVYLEQRKLGEAEDSLKKLEVIAPNNKELPFYRGLLHAARGDHERAVKDLEVALKERPENARAHYYLGLSYSRVNRPDKMVEHFQYFLKLAPDAPEAPKVRSLLRNVR